MEIIDVAIIGGGVAGLSTACVTAERGYSTCVLERYPRDGQGASTHNSGVIHAGIYYPTDSLKARACVEGKERLYRYCAMHGVPHKRIGKLIVATNRSQKEILGALKSQAAENGVDDLEWKSQAEVTALEPEI